MTGRHSEGGGCGCKWHTGALWAARIVIAVILLPTLAFKFSYATETQAIFDAIGGRPAATLTGVLELIAVVLLFVPRTVWVGAVVVAGLMGGAIMSHLTVLGIAVTTNPATGETDGGQLFAMATTALAMAIIVLWLRRRDIPSPGGSSATASA